MEEEAELKKELAREKETNWLKSKLISITTHELKTPLTVIKTSIEICLLEASRLEGLGHPMARFNKHFHRISREVDRLNSLMSNILDMERLNHGHIVPKTKAKDVRSLIQNILSEWIDRNLIDYKMILQAN